VWRRAMFSRTPSQIRVTAVHALQIGSSNGAGDDAGDGYCTSCMGIASSPGTSLKVSPRCMMRRVCRDRPWRNGKSDTPCSTMNRPAEGSPSPKIIWSGA